MRPGLANGMAKSRRESPEMNIPALAQLNAPTVKLLHNWGTVHQLHFDTVLLHLAEKLYGGTGMSRRGPSLTQLLAQLS